MWNKFLKWLLKSVLQGVEPLLAKWIDSEKTTLIVALEQADGKTVAKLICDKIREAL